MCIRDSTTPTPGSSAIATTGRAPHPPTLRQHQRADQHDRGGHRAVQHRPRRTSGERPLPEAGHHQRPEADRPADQHHPFGPQRQERLGRGEGDHERAPRGCDQGDHVPVDAEVRTEHDRHERCAEQPYRDRAEHPKGHGRHPHQPDPMPEGRHVTSPDGPGLAGAIGAGDVATFRHRVGLVGVATVTLGVLGTIAVWLLGAPLVPIVFGPDFSIDRDVITLIAASGGAFMIALAAAQALLALGAERVVLLAWAIGLGTLVVACLWQGPLAARAAWAMLDGAVAAMIVMVGALVLAQRRWARGTVGATDG